MSKSLLRVVSFVLVLGLVLTIPWWISVFLLIGLTIYFQMYIEVIFFGLLIDLLYSPNLTFPHMASTIALFLLLIVSFLRKYVRT